MRHEQYVFGRLQCHFLLSTDIIISCHVISVISHHISRVHTVRMISVLILTLILWLRYRLSGFSNVKLLLSSSYLVLFGKKSPFTVHSKEQKGVMLYFLKDRVIYINYFEFSQIYPQFICFYCLGLKEMMIRFLMHKRLFGQFALEVICQNF